MKPLLFPAAVRLLLGGAQAGPLPHLKVRKFSVNMDKITGAQVKAWWFNPRDGKSTAIGTFENEGQREFTPPSFGEMADWVLVLDDVAKSYLAPGARNVN